MTSNRIVVLALAVALQAGCVNHSKVMINDQGAQVVCVASGWGWLGTPLAAANYADCKSKQETLGFVKLEDFEKTEPAKVEIRSGVFAKTTPRPSWNVGDAWTYQLSGIRTGTLRQEVIEKQEVNNIQAYVVKMGDDRMFLSEDLNTVQINNKGKIITYAPPLQNFDWPIDLGKTWHSSGVMKTPTGELKTSKDVTVKGYGIVRVPAGEFEAFYILSTSDRGSRISEIWYAPAIRHHVKLVNYIQGGRIIAELTNFNPTSASR